MLNILSEKYIGSLLVSLEGLNFTSDKSNQQRKVQPNNMSAAGVLSVIFLFCGCFQFIFFKRKQQRTRDKRKGHIQGRQDGSTGSVTPSKVQQTSHLHKEQKKTTPRFSSRASHFSRPQSLSDTDKLWVQAFRYGCR